MDPEASAVTVSGPVPEEGVTVKTANGRAFTVTIATAESILPDLFREGQGVITQGKLGPDGVFLADEVLAKHDETYMPPEVAEALKKSGQWRGDDDDGGS